MSSIQKESFMYYVNDGVYGSFNCLIYDHAEVEPLVLEVRTLLDLSCLIFNVRIPLIDQPVSIHVVSGDLLVIVWTRYVLLFYQR